MRISVMMISAALILAITGAGNAGPIARLCWKSCGTNESNISYPSMEADATLIQTIRLDLKDSGAGRNRLSDPAKRDFERVIARYSATIMLDPKDDDAYSHRGIANLYDGSVSKALADITKASELDPQYPYYELWLHMLDKRRNQPSRLGRALP